MIYSTLISELGHTFLEVEYDETVPCVVMHWLGFSSTEDLKKGMEEGLHLLQEKKLSKWIADASKMEGGFTEANDWLEQDWTPRAIKAGLMHVAFVQSPDLFNEFSTQEYAERNADLENPHFTSLEVAKQWIKLR
ncbi:MAG: hypothetical protein EAZ55_13855 [Cytophagales bacterium]|nr:MAG: hypothetical protein EAZ55_13855 [Cytophagales bacterium]